MKIRYITLTQIVSDNKYLPIEYGGYVDLNDFDANENIKGVIDIKCTHDDLKNIEINWEGEGKYASLGECEIVIRDENFSRVFRANVLTEKLFSGYSITISPIKTF